MTKKFWNDWQNRIGETKQIYVYSGLSWSGYAQSHALLNTNDRIIKTTFYGDKVDLVIERHNEVINWSLRSKQQHVENEYKTLTRTDIKYIDF